MYADSKDEYRRIILNANKYILFQTKIFKNITDLIKQ